MQRDKNGKLIIDEKYIRPQKAMELMRTGQNANQTIYIYGATGFGKTSLIGSYFARKKYRYFTAEEQEELEGLVEYVKTVEQDDTIDKPVAIVLDDLHKISEDTMWEELQPVIQTMVKSKKIWLILVSRAPIPIWLKTIYIQDVFILIEEDELRFTKNDEDDYFEKWGVYPTTECRDAIHERCVGQPLIFRIVAMQLLSIGKGQKSEEKIRKELNALHRAQDDFYDYLENHVYDQWRVDLQEFMMDISIVEEFDFELAYLVTKKKHAGNMIRIAMEAGNFLMKVEEYETPTYRQREVLRKSMLRRLYRKKSKEHINNLYRNAGTYYELKGNAPRALDMYEKSEDKESVARLLVENTRNYAGAGNYWEFRKYYKKLPEQYILDDPELMAGMSLLQSILLNDEESERWYRELEEYAKQQRGSKRKLAKGKLLYLDIALPQRSVKNMVDILKNAAPVLLDRNNELPEFSLTNNSPSIMDGGKDFCEWSKKDKEIAKTIGPLVASMLGGFGKGLVKLALADSYFVKGEDNYEIASLANQGRMQAESGKPEMVFVATAILSQLSVLNNHVEEGVEMIESFRLKAEREAPWLLDSIDALLTRIYLRAGKSALVERWFQNSPDEDEDFCTLERYRYMTKVRVYLSMGKKEKAIALLQRMLAFAEQRNRTYIWLEAKVLLAITEYRMKLPNWKQTLQEAITKSEEYQFVRVLSKEGAALMPLFRKEEFQWDKKFKSRVLKDCEALATYYPAYLSEREGSVVLSDMALRILQLQAEGYSAPQIGKQLGMSADGVKYYNKETYKKLGVSSKAAAITEARNRKLL